MSASVKAPKQQKVKTTKKEEKDEVPVVSEPPKMVEVPLPLPVVDNEVMTLSTDAPSALGELISRVNKAQHDLTSLVSHLRTETKLLEKHVLREMKTLDKMNARKRKNQKGRAKSGFVKPTKISDDLADFLGLAHGTEIARTDVTKQITQYVRDNKLQDKSNGRRIIADAKLKKLLNYDENTVSDEKNLLSYFNLQRYITVHFAKAQAVA
jgi:chromatin remodeling complex protein RSC6